MPQKQQRDQTDLLLKKAAKNGWEAAFKESKGSPIKTLRAILTRLEKQTKEEVEDRLSENWRDNLFDILMTRFDFMTPHRPAFISLRSYLMQHPKTALRLLPFFMQTMEGVLSLAKVPACRVRTAPVVFFSAIYLAIVDAYIKDETKDLSKTMAFTDKALSGLERAFLFFDRGGEDVF